MNNNTPRTNLDRLTLDVSYSCQIPKSLAREVIKSFIKYLCVHFEAGEGLQIRGLGTFHVKYRKGRTWKNPRTGEIEPLSGYRYVQFKCSPKLRHRE